MGRPTLPDWLPPQLATLAAAAPAGNDWIHEIKYDGYRLLAWVHGEDVRLLTRNGKDWTERFPAVVGELASLGLGASILDGELVVELADGRSSFQALQNALSQADGSQALRYWVFDAPFLEERDLRAEPLIARKVELEGVLTRSGALRGRHVRFSGHVEANGPAFHEQACMHGLEGIISKRSSAPYRSGRNRDWLKAKCLREQEFVVVGYTAPGGSRKGLGALHVGTWEGGRLVYRGKVGTGYTEASLRQLVARLRPLKRPAPPFTGGPRGAAARGSTWVEPVLVAQVRFTEITDDGLLRHPVFAGLREDKEARAVAMEDPGGDVPGNAGQGDASPATETPGRSAKRTGDKPVTVAGVRLTSPDKVLYPGSGVTKRDLVAYYEMVADWMLPHLRDRPLTMVRCPAGHTGQCFFQKHFDRKSVPSQLELLEIEERDGPALYATLDALPGVASLVQLGTLELHTWNSRRDRLERPDRFIMDIDPDPGVTWDAVVDAALHLREVLQELGLVSFIKTTGGKGLHVVVPIRRRTSWDDVKSFSGGVAALLSRAAPELYTTDMAKARRKGRILLDFLRNARGATAVEAYSTRARDGATVAAPIHWDELADGVRADTFRVGNMADRVAELGEDPWAEMHSTVQSITQDMRRRAGVE